MREHFTYAIPLRWGRSYISLLSISSLWFETLFSRFSIFCITHAISVFCILSDLAVVVAAAVAILNRNSTFCNNFLSCISTRFLSVSNINYKSLLTITTGSLKIRLHNLHSNTTINTDNENQGKEYSKQNRSVHTPTHSTLSNRVIIFE